MADHLIPRTFGLLSCRLRYVPVRQIEPWPDALRSLLQRVSVVVLGPRMMTRSPSFSVSSRSAWPGRARVL
jgi:hypothetical protein